MLSLLLAIDIDIDPTMTDLGPFTLTWHGFFTAVGIILGVSLSVWLAKRDGIPSEVAQEIALVAVPSAIVGARLFYVFEHWDQFSGNIDGIITDINDGGITLYGGLLGGAIGGLVYGILRKVPIGIGLDIAAPGMILGQGIGRIGDLINGEHHADETSLPWAVRYVHPNTLGEFGKAVHPTAGGYELVGDFVILAILLFVCRRYFRVPGWVFAAYVGLYSLMRFFLSYTRHDEATVGDVPVPQIVAAALIGVAFILASYFYRYPGTITPEWAQRALGEVPEDMRRPRRRRGAEA
jgi:prolipoprotein diacylglyceryl transferase